MKLLLALLFAGLLSSCAHLPPRDGSLLGGLHGETFVSVSTASEIAIGIEAVHDAAKNLTVSIEVRTPPPGQAQAILVGKVKATIGRF